MCGAFVKLVQRAIKEGEEGRYHVEHALLLLAERLMAEYHSAVIDPHKIPDALNKELMTMHNSIMQECKRILPGAMVFT